MKQEIYKCPVCGLILHKSEKSFYCENKHSFDISSKGYTNLLLANQKSSKTPGDSKEMLLHRKNFLNSDYYSPLVVEINSIVKNFTEKALDNNLNFLDLGCGEGYYIDHLKNLIDTYNSNISYYGIDVSKYAIELASKRKAVIDFIVGNSFLLPFLDNSFDIIISVFSPINEEELKRVLKKGSIIITVGSGHKHLSYFIDLIYDNPIYPKSRNTLNESTSFELLEKKELNYPLNLKNNQAINNLFAMTPYYWQASAEKKDYILKLSELDIEVDFNIEVFIKK